MKDIIFKIEAAVPGQPGHYVFAGRPCTYCVVLVLGHPLKPHDLVVVIIAQPVHEICTRNPYANDCDLHPASLTIWIKIQ
jgi:hypothetical protein